MAILNVETSYLDNSGAGNYEYQEKSLRNQFEILTQGFF